jgi:glycosyltransferase involved in cell wall biosynthesis
MGEPFNRKAGQLVVEAFINLYGNNPDYRLIMKASGKHNLEIHAAGSDWSAPPDLLYSNIIIVEKVLTDAELLSLYSTAHCFVYPSWGEGFGFNPLQSMAMGIPTICTAGWAEYANYITLPLDSKWAWSPWQGIHPGYMLAPDLLQLERHMKDVVKYYDKYSKIAFKNAFKIHEEYDWERVSKPAIQRLKNIQKSRL